MATIRKAELAAQLEAARVEISRLKAQLEAERAQHQEQIDKHSHRNQLLVDENAALKEQLQGAQDVIDVAKKQIAQHKEQMESVTSVASAVNTMRRARPQYEMPAWQIERAQRMAAAKQLAMEMGRTVSVTKAVNE